ncbi:PepSY domain-containing protein [Bacillus infantis]|uniref:PepSY domain-containing protein n=1 Tax=Bacillus infantis TaxID=324767 RepID=UPI001CD20A67|nr:PepSY domain-containing protein [Bacillus infantis]MCA1038764.1 PepSY domain-containing protein [Bacillus infantis]
MNWKSFLLGVGVGVAGGLAAKELLADRTVVSPEKALDQAKAAFKKNGPISGSWIHMQPEPYEKHGLSYNVYKGGISRTADGAVSQYEFVADSRTGTILDAYPLS